MSLFSTVQQAVRSVRPEERAEHHHWVHALAAIPNNVPWYYLALAILLGAALLTHGATVLSRGWEKELKLPPWFSVAGQVTGIVLSTVMGGIAGVIIWQAVLGAMVGFVGGVASQVIMVLVRAKVEGAKSTLREVKDLTVNGDPKE